MAAVVEDMGQIYLADPNADGDEARTLRALRAAAITYRIAFGPRAGQKVLTLRGAMAREVMARQLLCSDIDGFSLHAAVRVEAHERKRLEQLCRYITRPALSDERVQLNAAGQVELKLKTPWRDGTTHLVMSPLEFMQRLAALVPRPRLHLIRFHGVLAPNAKLRSRVVPQGPPTQAPAATEAPAGGESEGQTVQARAQRISWARLLKRVFDIDMQRCPNCGAGELKIIAAILERAVIEKILSHLGLDPQPPPKGRAREPGLNFAALVACAVGYLSPRAAVTLQPPVALRAVSARHGQHQGQLRLRFHPARRKWAKDRPTRQPRTHIRLHSALNPPSLAYFGPLQTWPGAFLGRPMAVEIPVPGSCTVCCVVCPKIVTFARASRNSSVSAFACTARHNSTGAPSCRSQRRQAAHRPCRSDGIGARADALRTRPGSAMPGQQSHAGCLEHRFAPGVHRQLALAVPGHHCRACMVEAGQRAGGVLRRRVRRSNRTDRLSQSLRFRCSVGPGDLAVPAVFSPTKLRSQAINRKNSRSSKG